MITDVILKPDVVSARRSVFRCGVARCTLLLLENRSPANRRRWFPLPCSGVAAQGRRCKCCEIGRQVGDLGIRQLRPVHRRRDRLRTWSSRRAMEAVHVQGPVAATPRSDGTALGRAIRSVAQSVAQKVVRMCVGVATMAAHPAVVRELGTVKKPLSS